MKKVLVMFLLVFFVFGMLSNFVLSDNHTSVNDSDSSGSGSDSNVNDSDGLLNEPIFVDNSGSGSGDDEDNKTDDDSDSSGSGSRETRVRREFTTEDGRSVEVDRRVEVEDGKRSIRVYRKVTDAQGNVREIRIRIEEEDGRRKIRIEGREDLDVDTELEIESDFEGNESDLIAIDSRRVRHRVKVLPDRVEEIIKARFRLGENVNITDIELKEIRERNIPRVVYNVQTNQNGRFLGIFKIRARLNSEIDPETGEVISDRGPWWAFLVSLPGDVDEDGNETSDDVEEEDEVENETDDEENDSSVNSS